jgi:hypothetical protein
VVTVQTRFFQERESVLALRKAVQGLPLGQNGYGPLSQILDANQDGSAAGSLTFLMWGFLFLQTIAPGGQYGHATETQEKPCEDATEENDDAHVTTSLHT